MDVFVLWEGEPPDQTRELVQQRLAAKVARPGRTVRAWLKYERGRVSVERATFNRVGSPPSGPEDCAAEAAEALADLI
jgi:hypothetical protein